MNGGGGLSEADLFGTWKLEVYRFEYDDGTSEEPYGPEPIGMLHYADDGFVFLHMMAAGREALGTDTSIAHGDAAKAALGSHISYCGTFSLVDHIISHDIKVSVLQDFVGLTLKRKVELAEASLTLRAANSTFGGKSGTAVLQWRRAI